jgi:WhiB family redox-sensing transcriptional regulator
VSGGPRRRDPAIDWQRGRNQDVDDAAHPEVMSLHDSYLGPDWQDRAACGSDAESFFDPKRADEALAICARCVVREPCAAYAEANDEQHGIWGGVVRGFIPAGGNRKGWSERRAG